MSDLEDYPKRNENGKVKNPLTGNWVKPSYAKKQDILEQAEQHTQQHFREQDSSEADEIDRLLREAENVDAGEAFEIDDEDLESLTDEELERLDEHAELPDSPFPDESEFDPDQGAEPDTFQQPPTPEGLENAAQQQSNTSGQGQGIYSSKSAQPQQSREGRTKASSRRDKGEVNYRWVKTDAGGMKKVYLNEEE